MKYVWGMSLLMICDTPSSPRPRFQTEALSVGVVNRNAIVANRSTKKKNEITQLTCGYGCRNQRLRALAQLWVHFMHLSAD